MSLSRAKKIYRVLLRSTCLILAIGSSRALALGEQFDFYTAPQAVALGNAFAPLASGHTSLFYNPAGLARGTKKAFDWKPIALDFISSFGAASTAISAQTLGMNRLLRQVPAHPNRYHFIRSTLMPAYSGHGFGIAMLGSYRFAAQSTDGVNVDVDSGNDVGMVLGGATGIAGNLIKVGVSLKTIARNQLKGVYDPTTFADDRAISSAMKTGLGVGGDLGFLFTLPQKYLPTLSLVWNDAMGTQFIRSKFLNAASQGTPDNIPQSFHAGLSIQPSLSKRLRTVFSTEFKHIERSDWPVRKKIHLGMQIETDRAFFVWLGMNQLYLTGGIALRLPGGDLEVGSYAEDVGEGTTLQQDRRFFMRYTIGF